jgi:uncharacterized protein
MTRLTWILLGAVALVVAWQLARGARAFRSEFRAMHPARARVARPADADALGLVDVRFPARDGATIAGWYAPSRTGAALLLCGGSGDDRTGMLAQARLLAGAGYGVLLFDWPGSGESGGRMRVGAPEHAAVEGALDWLAARTDVHDGRVGLLAFSLGTYIATPVAVADGRVRALVLEGAFPDVDEQTRVEYAHAGPASSWGAVLGTRAGGLRLEGPRPTEIIGRFAPRPVLFIMGTADRVVPPALTRVVFGAAREPRELWEIAGAAHGDYLDVDPTFGPRLLEFLGRTLAEPAAVPTAR